MKTSKMALVLLVVLGTTTNSQAFIGQIIKTFMKDSYSNGHGYGLPKKVGKSEYAEEYRQNFMDQMGISSEVDELGLEQYSRNSIGLALIKRGNDDEAAFNTVLAKKEYRSLRMWRNGPNFIRALEKYTEKYGCIPKITSVSHGWASADRKGEGNGLSGNNGINGIYATNKHVPDSLGKIGTRSLEGHLADKIKEGKIQFCSSCIAQFYACNVGTKFASTFSEVTGCQTVVATGQNSPWFQSFDSEEDRQKVYEGAHYWKSAPGVWEESNTMAKKKGYDAMGTWFRSTPVKNSKGKVIDMVKENLGGQYISL